jgi:cyclopropane-fatty-acyl-phospholipid synthase
VLTTPDIADAYDSPILRSDAADMLRGLPAEVVRRYQREGVYGLGETYINGLWSVEPLDEFLFKIFRSDSTGFRRFNPYILGYLLKEKIFNSQKLRAFEIADRHYNLGNDLFSAMLDTSMTYTCGYWQNAGNLAQAQEAKLELICAKLQLNRGMRVLDIGCGWGNFAHYAATRHGVHVTGLTVSDAQAEYARKRCQGLPVEIHIQDYRSYEGSFDRVVSIEMIEAVGKRNLPVFFDVVHRSLKSGGLFLLQAISAETVSLRSPILLDQYIMWILKHIFPNGYLPKMDELMDPAKDRFVLEDVHGFGPDYDRTLLAWESNFVREWPKLAGKFDEEFKRMWRFYLLGCAALFRARMVQVYQLVYSKAGSSSTYRIQR